MVPVSLGLQSKQRVVATAAVADRRLTPKPNRMGNMVTISSIARPEALLMHRPMSIPIKEIEKYISQFKDFTVCQIEEYMNKKNTMLVHRIVQYMNEHMDDSTLSLAKISKINYINIDRWKMR